LIRLLAEIPNPVISEYLPGAEYTVDCFTDRHGALLFAGPRSRDVVKMGIAFASRIAPLSRDMEEMALGLNAAMRPRGLWFFQAREDSSGRPKLLEMSCRASSSMGLYRQLGVNFPLLALYDALDMDVRVLCNKFDASLHRCVGSRYRLDCSYGTVYVDYDDTLVVDGKVNANMVRFLYECVNRGKRLVLLSRHLGDLERDMRRMKLPLELFDRIVHIADGGRKSDYITERDAILIDNLFPERAEVHERLGIPVFDVDAAENLLQADSE
jgi:hypothetical protein